MTGPCAGQRGMRACGCAGTRASAWLSSGAACSLQYRDQKRKRYIRFFPSLWLKNKVCLPASEVQDERWWFRTSVGGSGRASVVQEPGGYCRDAVSCGLVVHLGSGDNCAMGRADEGRLRLLGCGLGAVATVGGQLRRLGAVATVGGSCDGWGAVCCCPHSVRPCPDPPCERASPCWPRCTRRPPCAPLQGCAYRTGFLYRLVQDVPTPSGGAAAPGTANAATRFTYVG